MRSSGKICLWNEGEWDEQRWVELHTGNSGCELTLHDSGLGPEISTLGAIPIDLDMLMAAANGATCEISREGVHCSIRRDGEWAVVRFQFEDFPFPSEWRLGALWFQSAVWSCLAHRSGGPYFF